MLSDQVLVVVGISCMMGVACRARASARPRLFGGFVSGSLPRV
jgi:hypothetical protein